MNPVGQLLLGQSKIPEINHDHRCACICELRCALRLVEPSHLSKLAPHLKCIRVTFLYVI